MGAQVGEAGLQAPSFGHLGLKALHFLLLAGQFLRQALAFRQGLLVGPQALLVAGGLGRMAAEGLLVAFFGGEKAGFLLLQRLQLCAQLLKGPWRRGNRGPGSGAGGGPGPAVTG